MTFPNRNSLGYAGNNAINIANLTIFKPARAPNSTDCAAYTIGDEALDQSVTPAQWYKLVSKAGNVATWEPLTYGTGEVSSITATAPLTANGVSGSPQYGAVTIADTSGLIWNGYSTVGPITMVSGNGYIGNVTDQVTLTLPATGVVLQSIVKVVTYGAGGVVIAQQASTQIVLFSGGTTTAGVDGYVTTDASQTAVVSLICIATPSTPGSSVYLWAQFEASQGNMTVT